MSKNNDKQNQVGSTTALHFRSRSVRVSYEALTFYKESTSQEEQFEH
jgi:hypothetical protein